MRSLPSVVISVLLSASFAALAVLALYAAEDGAAQTAAWLGIAPGRLDLLAGKPIFAGICVGCALVAAMYATAGLSILLDAEGRREHDVTIVDIATGGGLAIAVVAGLGAFLGSADTIAMIAAGAVAVLVAARTALQAANALPPESEPSAEPLLRAMALEAARNANVVRFPLARARGG